MDREQAKNYTSQPKTTFTALQNMGYWAAVGYLEALDGPEISELVQSVKDLEKSSWCKYRPDNCGECHECYTMQKLFKFGLIKALSTWKNDK